MWFKNLRIYRLSDTFNHSPEQLEQALAERPARDCGSLEAAAVGWDKPLGRNAEMLTHSVGGKTLICMRKQERVLPAAVVKEELDERVQAIEEQEMRKVSRKEKSDLKDSVAAELLPRAFVRSKRTFAYLDPANGWLLADAGASKPAEELIELLRETLGTLVLKPVGVNQAPTAVMTAWLTDRGPEGGFMVGDECELRNPLEEGSVVRGRKQDLYSEEMQAHLTAGKQVFRLALDWQERIGFVADEELTLRRLQFLDLVKEEAEHAGGEDAAARFDADFTIMTGELERFIPALFEVFGGAEE